MSKLLERVYRFETFMEFVSIFPKREWNFLQEVTTMKSPVIIRADVMEPQLALYYPRCTKPVKSKMFDQYVHVSHAIIAVRHYLGTRGVASSDSVDRHAEEFMRKFIIAEAGICLSH